MNILAILVPISGVIALLFALGYALSINKKSPGNERMREIADAISTGAKAFLFSEYKILIVFVLLLFAAIMLLINTATAVCFVIGAVFSTLARGLFGVSYILYPIHGKLQQQMIVELADKRANRLQEQNLMGNSNKD